jgi:outer membrane protein OmpA-like peptidoglycan-associated protein
MHLAGRRKQTDSRSELLNSAAPLATAFCCSPTHPTGRHTQEDPTMRRRHSLFAATTTALMLAASVASAQPVQIFDEAPPLELLRSIMIPESNGGTSRSIVIQKPDTSTRPSSVQRAATTVAAPATHTTSPATAVAAKSSAAPATSMASEPKAAPAQSAEAAIVGFRINFAFDSDVLPHSALDFVDRIAELMKEAPQLKLRVEGHTDAVGTPEYNLTLSKRRALSVAEYLVDHRGIAPDRFVLVGKGMSEPLVEDGSDSRNRRVQFVRVS